MRISTQKIFLLRWLKSIWRSIWSKKTLIIFILSLALAEFIWWKFFNLEMAKEQALENLIPAFACVIVTFVVITFIQFFKIRELIKVEGNERELMKSQKEDELKTVSAWLSRNLEIANIGIAEACLFGSITHNIYETTDVDLLLFFKEMSDKKYIDNLHKLKTIENEFYRTFGKKLHLQRYVSIEKEKYLKFISMQSDPIWVIQSHK